MNHAWRFSIEVEDPQRDGAYFIRYQYWSALADNFEVSTVRGSRIRSGLLSLYQNEKLIGEFSSRAELIGRLRKIVDDIKDKKLRELSLQHFYLIEQQIK